MSAAEVETDVVALNKFDKYENAKIPSSRVDKMLRKKFADKRIASATPKYLSAAIEDILTSILSRAGDAARADGKKRATLQHLMRAVRSDRGTAKLFRTYIFASNNGIKFNSMALLNANDRETALKKREEEKKKKAGSAVPSIDQE